MDLPDEMFGAHDVTVDWIVTPTRVIQCPKTNKPEGIIWHLLDRQKLKRVSVVIKYVILTRQAETQTGECCNKVCITYWAGRKLNR